MNRRSFLNATVAAGVAAALPSRSTVIYAAQLDAQSSSSKAEKSATERSPTTILLKDYRPKSLHKVPVTEVAKAKFPIIDMHSHPYAETPVQVDDWVRNMDEVGVQKTIILTMKTGAEFDAINHRYNKYPD